MNPLHLYAQNYRTFDTLDLDLPDGCVAIIGENGAGKSSIVNAIDLAIFGPDGRTLADDHTEGSIDPLTVELELEHAGALYRIRRTFDPRGRGKTSLDFERLAARVEVDGQVVYLNVNHPELAHTGEWHPLSAESVKETQAVIERTLGLSRETFRASAFLAQGDGAAFTAAQPRDRKRILANVLGLERWDERLAAVRVETRRVQDQIQQLDGRVAHARELARLRPGNEETLDHVEQGLVVLADEIADLARERASLVDRTQAARERAAIREAREAEYRAAGDNLDRLRSLDQRARAAEREIAAARESLSGLPAAGQGDRLRARVTELEAAVAAHERARTEHALATARADAAMRDRDELLERSRQLELKAEAARAAAEDLHRHQGDHDPLCDRCEQPLGTVARARAAASLIEEAQHAEKEAMAHRNAAAAIEIPTVPDAREDDRSSQELDTVRVQLRVVEQAAAERARLEERIVGLQRDADARPGQNEIAAALAAALAAADAALAALNDLGQPEDTDALTREIATVEQALNAKQRHHVNQVEEKARLVERLAQIADAEQQIAAAEQEQAKLVSETVMLAHLERAFRPDGIPMLIVENTAIPYLETESNRILAELGTVFGVELRTQAALKSGDGVRDTLDVVVTGDSGERAYETFSGGEKTRINLALRIALARLLANRRGADSRLLVVDEPEFLDEQGTARLVDVLRGLQGDFDKLYVVSHVPGLRDSFDTTLAVVRDGAASAVVEAGVFEVAA